MEQSLAGNQKELDLVERELQQMEVSSISAHLVCVHIDVSHSIKVLSVMCMHSFVHCTCASL